MVLEMALQYVTVCQSKHRIEKIVINLKKKACYPLNALSQKEPITHRAAL